MSDMLALPHSHEELDFLTNPEEDFWTLFHPAWLSNGWSFVLKDFDHLRETSANFWFFVAVEKETKQPISCVLLALDEASIDGEDPLYSMGYYYTDPEWRCLGVGSKLFKMALDVVGIQNIALNSVFEMVQRYRISCGADHLTDYVINMSIIYMKDIAPPKQAKGLAAKELNVVEWRDVVDYDVKVRTRKREKYLRKLLEPSDDVFSRIILDDKGKVVGFGSVRVLLGGCLSLGPLFADNKDVARFLFDTAMTLIDKEKYSYVDVMYPSCNPEAERFVSEVSGGKVQTTEYAQPQFTKHAIPFDKVKVFSLSEVAMSYI